MAGRQFPLPVGGDLDHPRLHVRAVTSSPAVIPRHPELSSRAQARDLLTGTTCASGDSSAYWPRNDTHHKAAAIQSAMKPIPSGRSSTWQCSAPPSSGVNIFSVFFEVVKA